MESGAADVVGLRRFQAITSTKISRPRQRLITGIVVQSYSMVAVQAKLPEPTNVLYTLSTTKASAGTAADESLLHVPVPVTLQANVLAPLIRSRTRKNPLAGTFAVTTLTRRFAIVPAGMRIDAACWPWPVFGKFSLKALLMPGAVY